MIVNIGDGTAIWFGQKMNNGKDISFEDGVFMVLNTLGRNVARSCLDSLVDEIEFGTKRRASLYSSADRFLNDCRIFIKSLTAHKEFPFPDHATIIGARPEFENNPKWLARELKGFMNR